MRLRADLSDSDSESGVGGLVRFCEVSAFLLGDDVGLSGSLDFDAGALVDLRLSFGLVFLGA